jgi:hypothetical protein
MDPISLGSRREFFWDDFLVDTARTTATPRLHHPQPQEVVMVHDAPWEGDGCDFHCIVRDKHLYRMYYLAWKMLDPDATEHKTSGITVAYAESTDGLTWAKPDLGLCEFNGSRKNNIILDQRTAAFDNFSVLKDPNPGCLPTEIYKGVGLDGRDKTLWCFTSSDGVRFTKAWPMTDRGAFDTLNIALWDRHRGRYRCYIRDLHPLTADNTDPHQRNRSTGSVRDVRWIESTDFRNWSVPQRLDFGDVPDCPLYTNVVQPYYRADHVFVGFPSRYVERTAWTPNYDQLPGAEARKKLVAISPRYGLTVTDCVFMSSRDGRRWHRWEEAFMTPGVERERNWVYGDCFPAVGMIETPSRLPGAPMDLSLYAFDNHWSQQPAELRRYTLRVDGFASYHATYKPQSLVTKPFIFSGRDLSINFASSAAGFVTVRLCADDCVLTSGELFGNSLDRRVAFEGGDVSRIAGQPVTMEMELSDADIYSFQFMP